jgi:hypothetical protein
MLKPDPSVFFYPNKPNKPDKPERPGKTQLLMSDPKFANNSKNMTSEDVTPEAFPTEKTKRRDKRIL